MFRNIMEGLQGLNLPPEMEAPQSTPEGLKALYGVFNEFYPDQRNPLAVVALIKYWLGGPDPLDYINMFANPGNEELGVPPHWHYISLGLTDLHGDNRIHSRTGPNQPSGFGFELTFRLARKPEETEAPTWPANLMQRLARYVFKSGNIFCPGDHVTWHSPLGEGSGRITQLLMAKDTQLPEKVYTPNGEVSFVQIIGVTPEELQAAQHWTGTGVINLLKEMKECGPWLVTDINRSHSIMEADPTVAEKIQMGIEEGGSNLGGVSAKCWWRQTGDINPAETYREKKSEDSDDEDGDADTKDGDDEAESSNENPLIEPKKDLPGESEGENPVMEEPSELKILPGIHLTFNLEAGSLLPLVIKGRIKHGRHFTFKALSSSAITFVAPSVTGSHVTPENPYVARGIWVHVLIPNALADQMANEFKIFDAPQEIPLPKTFSWPEYKLEITIISD